METQWSYILAGRDRQGSRYEEAWRYLFATFHPVIQGYFRRQVDDEALSAEWADEFMARWVEGSLDSADPQRGRFRHYLYRALRNFAIDRYRARRRGRWTWGQSDVDLERIEAEPEEPDAAFIRDFVLKILSRALDRLREYQGARQLAGQQTLSYTLIEESYIQPTSTSGRRPSARALADRHGMTVKAVERQLAYAREKLRGWITEELRQTVSSAAELEEEIQLVIANCSGLFDGEPA